MTTLSSGGMPAPGLLCRTNLSRAAKSEWICRWNSRIKPFDSIALDLYIALPSIARHAAFHSMKAILALEDGTVFHGQAFGARASACGEVCFNTSMTGYQEILTDPSYKGQIVTMTYPLIGNYGVNDQDVESWRPHVAGFVIRELSPVVSNWRADYSLAEYLERNGIPGLQGIDTRALTKKLRVSGALKGFISTEEITDAEAVSRARKWQGLVGVDYVKEVTHKEAFLWDEKDAQS